MKCTDQEAAFVEAKQNLERRELSLRGFGRLVSHGNGLHGIRKRRSTCTSIHVWPSQCFIG